MLGAGAGLGQAVGVGAGLDDVAAEGEPINNGRAEPGVGERLRPTIWGWYLFGFGKSVLVAAQIIFGVTH